MAPARPINIATAIAGTLDLLSAFVFAGLAARRRPRFSNSSRAARLARWRRATPHPRQGAAVHLAITACMVTAYMIAACYSRTQSRRPIPSGIAYGLVLWGLLYRMIRPLRWPDMPLPHTVKGIVQQLFSIFVCVGVPIAARTRPNQA